MAREFLSLKIAGNPPFVEWTDSYLMVLYFLNGMVISECRGYTSRLLLREEFAVEVKKHKNTAGPGKFSKVFIGFLSERKVKTNHS